MNEEGVQKRLLRALQNWLVSGNIARTENGDSFTHPLLLSDDGTTYMPHV